MKTSIPRIRSVTDKASGRQIRVLRHQYLNDRKHIEKRLMSMLDVFFADGKRAGGFAFTIWDTNGESVTGQSAFENGNIPKAMVPDFVKNLLLLNTSRDW